MTQTDERVEVTANAVLQALRERRSMPQVAPEVPPRDLVRQVIEAGTWGPNHHRTEPWRFAVLAGEARERFGAFLADLKRRELEDPDSDGTRAALEKERAKPLRAPYVIAVAAVPTGHPKAVDVEEIAAVAAGVENMLIAAESLGLHAMWRTGWPAFDDDVKRYLGFPESSHIVAFVYLGYPVLPRVPRARDGADRFITWHE